MRMEGQMLYLLLFKILRVIGFQWHAVVAHALWAVPAHLLVAPSKYLSILLI